jgi:hypothetical protein
MPHPSLLCCAYNTQPLTASLSTTQPLTASLFLVQHVACADPEGASASGGKRAPRRIPSNESFSSLSLAIKAMTRFGPSSYGNLQVR